MAAVLGKGESVRHQAQAILRENGYVPERGGPQPGGVEAARAHWTWTISRPILEFFAANPGARVTLAHLGAVLHWHHTASAIANALRHLETMGLVRSQQGNPHRLFWLEEGAAIEVALTGEGNQGKLRVPGSARAPWRFPTTAGPESRVGERSAGSSSHGGE